MSRLLPLGHTVRVVQRLRPVEAEPDGKAFFRQKATPIVIEQDAIRLYAVHDASVRGQVLALELDNRMKIVQPEEGRFAALPKESDRWPRGNLDLLNDVLL